MDFFKIKFPTCASLPIDLNAYAAAGSYKRQTGLLSNTAVRQIGAYTAAVGHPPQNEVDEAVRLQFTYKAQRKTPNADILGAAAS